MQVVHLPAPAQLPADGVGDDAGVVLQHVGLHRVPVVGGLLDDGHVPDAGEGHVQRPGDGGGGEGEHVGGLAHLLELLLLGHAEALLLVDDDQPQVVELHVFAHQPVGAHHDVDAAPLHLPQDLVLLLGGAEPGKQLHVHREALHAL